MGIAWMAIILMVVIAEGNADPKPILVNYFGIPASQYPSEVYRYDPRAKPYGEIVDFNQQRGGFHPQSQGGQYFIASPHHGGYVTPEYAVEEPQSRLDTGHYGDDHQGGVVHGGYYVDPSSPPPPSPTPVTVRPLQYNNREYPSGPINYQQREYNPVVVPNYDASYNGIVRRAGIGEDGRDHHGEAGSYAIRGGVFPAVGLEPGEYRAEGGDFNARYREYEPNNYYGDDNTRPLGYNSQIHNRGDVRNPNFDKEAYGSSDFGPRNDGYGARQSERDYYGERQIHKKVPVRGINSRAPQVFYPSRRQDEINEHRN